ncbi:MAG: S8 family serine peptidase [Deltaproteobacteria bacterium]|nr:S8 family serine peptidase [Deltaproteobacteria bacterium]
MHRSALLFAVLLFPAASTAHHTQEVPGRGRVVARELIVRVRPGTTTAELRALEARTGVTILEESTATGALLVQPPQDGTLSGSLDRLAHDPAVADVAFNSIARAASPDDPYFYLQWNLEAVGAYENDTTPDATNVTVAVVDTGIAQDAPDLWNVPFSPEGYDFVNHDADPTDDHQHGTHLAGIIAQATDNSLGTAGLAVGATLVSIKVLDAGATGDEYTIMEGIAGAVAAGAEVINLSFEFGPGYVPSRAMEDTVRDALDAGAVLVGAAGNGGTDVVSYPAAFRGVIAVGAASLQDANGTIGRAPYSNYGPELDVLAPGGDLDLDTNGDGIPEGILAETFDPADPGTFEPYLLEGTSGAAAHVTATAALLIAGGTPSSDVQDAITATATDLGEPGYDIDTGAGMVEVTPGEIPPPKIVIPNAEVLVARERDNCSVRANATVVIRDQLGEPIEGALVYGRWGGSVSQTPSPLGTNPDGEVTFTSPGLTFEPDRRRNRCSDDVDRGTLFMFAVNTVAAPDGSTAHPGGKNPDGWYLAWLLPERGTRLRGAGLVLPPTGLDYVDRRPRGTPRQMDAALLEPFGLVFGSGGRREHNDFGPIRGAVIDPYTGWVLAVHDLDDAEGVVFAGGGNPDPGDDPIVEELDAEWEAFSTGVAVFSHSALRWAGGGNPDPGDMPGALSVVPDAPVMLRALEDGRLGLPPPPPATDAARLVRLSLYLQ